MVVRLGVGVYALALGRRHLSRIGNPDEGQTVADVTLVFYFACPCSISSALRTAAIPKAALGNSTPYRHPGWSNGPRSDSGIKA
jgi:hypothetical protein